MRAVRAFIQAVSPDPYQLRTYSLYSLTLPSTPDQGCPLSLFLLRNIHNDTYLGTY